MTMLETSRPTGPEPLQSEDVVVPIPADLDISTLGKFREALSEALSSRPSRLVVDFSACRYLDAQAIRVLLDAHQELWRRDGRLVLRACNADSTRLLALAGVLNVFQLESAPVAMA